MNKTTSGHRRLTDRETLIASALPPREDDFQMICDRCVDGLPPDVVRVVCECPTCKRVVLSDDVFVCGWCDQTICGRCVYVEHGLDGCTNPDDCCGYCGELYEDCECGEA